MRMPVGLPLTLRLAKCKAEEELCRITTSGNVGWVQVRVFGNLEPRSFRVKAARVDRSRDGNERVDTHLALVSIHLF